MFNNSSNNNLKSDNNSGGEFSYQIYFIIILAISFVISIIIYDKIRTKIGKIFYEILEKLGNYSYDLINFRNENLKHQRKNDPGDLSTEGSKNSKVNEESINFINMANNGEKEMKMLKVKTFELKGNIKENKKYYDDSMFLKTFLGRLIITYYSFYGLIFIFNFAIQFLTLIPGAISKIDCKFIEYLILIFYIVYSIFYSRILLIPAFEFFSFPFIRYKDSLIHLWTFNYIAKNKKFKSGYSNKNNEILNYFLRFIQLFYLISFILGILTNHLTLMDYFNSFILSIIYIYYLTIFFSYFIIIGYLWIKEKIFLQKNNKKSFPDINLLSYFFDFSKKEEQDLIKKKKKPFIYILYLIEFLAFLVVIFYIFIKFLAEDRICLIFIFYFLLGLFFRFNYFLCCGIKRKTKQKNTLMIFLLSLLSIMVCIIISLGLIYILYLGEGDKDNLSEFNKFKFNSIRPSNEYLDENTTDILPSICTASVYNIPIISYIPFINDAYYYENNTSSLSFSNYRNIFFNDDEYKITQIRNLIKDKTKTVKMIQYNLESPKNNNNVTILSIKGTSYNTDVYLDIQLYTPSVFLNLLLEFSIFMKLKDTKSFHLLEYSLSLPYRIFFKESIIDDYIKVLNETYNNISKEFDKNNVIIVGHSLGGGLSKILGKMVKKPSISLSGPGANAFHSLWGEDGISDNFDITTIDLVPDMDLVPRVEVSGGTIYRIICREGTFGCHSKDLSLCEVLIMCQKPHQIVCEDIADIHGDKLERIKQASKLFKK